MVRPPWIHCWSELFGINHLSDVTCSQHPGEGHLGFCESVRGAVSGPDRIGVSLGGLSGGIAVPDDGGKGFETRGIFCSSAF